MIPVFHRVYVFGPYVDPHDVYVTQHARCVGIGRALVLQVASYAKAHNMSYLMLETQQNQRAQGLYEGLGFVRNQDFYIYELELHRGLE